MVTSKQAVLGKLGIHGGVTSAMVPQLQLDFEPSVLITAGKIDRLGGLISSFKEPLTDAIEKVMMPSIATNFAEGGRPPWEPLSDATTEIRARMGVQGGSPLIKTGALSAAAASKDIWKIGDAAATVQGLPDNVWYGKIHQAGYGGKSMKTRVAAAGGDKKKALDSLLDDQFKAMKSGTTMSGGAAPIPARPFIMFQDQDEDDITEVFIDWVGKKIEEAWPV